MKIKILQFLFLTFVFASCQDDTPAETDVITFADNLYGGTGGVSVDKDGNIYSSDFGPFLGTIPNFNFTTRVFKITPQGTVTVFADSLTGSSGSDFDSEGNLYQSNIRGGYISKISPAGVVEMLSKDSIIAPVGVYYNADNLIVCNCGNNTLRKVDSDGNSVLFSSGDVFQCPNGITKSENGDYYVSNFSDGWVLKITSEGEASRFAEIPGNNNGHLIYRDGFLYVVARSAHQIYKVSMDADVDLFAGSGDRGRKNSTLLESTFSYPNDLDFSPDGKFLYVNEMSDTLSGHRVLTPTTVRRLKVN